MKEIAFFYKRFALPRYYCSKYKM